MKPINHHIIPTTDVDYPNSLKYVLDERQLFGMGNTNLLTARAVGICGSRDASKEALEYAFKFGWEAAEHDFVVVSGYARGVDRRAHEGALQAGGSTIAVLAEGITSFRLINELAPLVTSENFLAISMYPPSSIWRSWQAMERNKLIVALSIGLFVVEAKEKGGTINAALECVKQKKPLWAIAYSKDIKGREGNAKLIQEAAIPLKKRQDLQEALDYAAAIAEEDIRQLAFNLS